jgi:hypothetical protein
MSLGGEPKNSQVRHRERFNLPELVLLLRRLTSFNFSLLLPLLSKMEGRSSTLFEVVASIDSESSMGYIFDPTRDWIIVLREKAPDRYLSWIIFVIYPY